MKRQLVSALLCCGLLPSTAHSLDRIGVEVVCELREHRYRLQFTDEQIADIEDDCGRLLAALLDRRVRFLDFTHDAASGNRMVIRIGKSAAEVNPLAFRPVELDISVQGDDVAPGGEPVTWTFRTLAEWLEVPSADTFADAVALRFAEELESNEAHLVEAQLSRLQIAESAFPLPDDLSWLLPFERGDLGIADDSQLRIRAELRTPSSSERFTYTVELFGDFTSGTGVPPEFYNKVKALHLRDDKLGQEASIRRLGEADVVDVLYVAVSRYVPAVEPVRTAPSDLDLE